MFLQHLLVVGLPLLLLPLVAMAAVAQWGIAAFADDFPDDVKAALPEFTSAERRRGHIFGSIFLIALVGSVGSAVYTWVDGEHASGFWQAFAMALATFFAFCLIDLVIVDWLVICWWRPRWIVVPGTEDAEGWGDYMFHVREQLSPAGLSAMIGMPLVIAAVVTLVHALV